MEFIANYTSAELGLFVFLVGYGTVLGVSNTFRRIWSIISGKQLTQNDLGKLLDVAFYAGILYLVLK